MKEMPRKAVEVEKKHDDTSANHERANNDEGAVLNQKRKRGRQPKVFFQAGSPKTKEADAVDDLRNNVAKVLNGGADRDVETVIARTSSDVSDDDRPLSAWFEGAHSPLTTDGTGLCDENGERIDLNKKQPDHQTKDKAQEKKDEKTPDDYVSNDNNAPERQDGTPMNIEDLPFVKNSLIWEMIESMEVFKRIPQKPHFRPLYNYKEECREGLAIGNMVTFTSLVDRVSRLRFGDPKNLIDGYLEALVDLEELGFNVGPVRDQLNNMLVIKSRQEQVLNTSKEIESQTMEREHEKSKMSEEIAELDKKIGELNEKRALAISRKEMKDVEIALLQSSVDAVKGSLDRAKVEFEKVAASFW